LAAAAAAAAHVQLLQLRVISAATQAENSQRPYASSGICCIADLECSQVDAWDLPYSYCISTAML
jgi:hypothetical protein